MGYIDGKIVFVTDERSNCWICWATSVTDDGTMMTNADYCVATGTLTTYERPHAFGKTESLDIRSTTGKEELLFMEQMFSANQEI